MVAGSKSCRDDRCPMGHLGDQRRTRAIWLNFATVGAISQTPARRQRASMGT